MKYKLKLILIIITVFATTNIMAQSYSEIRADKQFENFSYPKAMELYEEAVESGKGNDHVIRQLATGYRLMNNSENAAKWLKELIGTSSVEPIDYYYYGQALKSNGKYDEADEYLEKYFKLKPNDTRAISFHKTKGFRKIAMADSSRYNLQLVSVNSKYADFGATFYKDKVVIASARAGKAALDMKHSWNDAPFLDLYVCDKDEEFDLSSVKPMSVKINTRFHEGPVSFTKDGSLIFFTRNNFLKGKVSKDDEGVNNLKIYYSKVKSLNDSSLSSITSAATASLAGASNAFKENETWGDVLGLPFNSDDYSVGHPSISVDGNTLYFSSDMPGGIGGVDIYKCTFENDKWDKPENLGKPINTEGNEMFPFYHEGGILYFASNGHQGLGGLDVFVSDLKKGKDKEVVNMGYPLNTPKDDFCFIFDPTNTKGYISSNRYGGPGDDDIYKFTLNCMLEVVVKDENDGSLLPNSDVIVKDKTGQIVAKGITDKNAMFKSVIDAEKQFELSGKRHDYNENQKDISTQGIASKAYILKEELLLNSGVYALEGLVSYKSTLKPISEVDIVLKNSKTNEMLTALTNEKGDFYFNLSADTDYDLVLSKSMFFSKKLDITTVGKRPGVIKVHELFDFSDGDMIVLEDLYYDFDKWNIRNDAQIVLNKLVVILKAYPDISIELGSHTDARGSGKYNEWLSQRRADSAIKYIKSQGISKNRLSAKGYGENKLTNNCKDGVNCDAKEHQANRRTEVKIAKK